MSRRLRIPIDRQLLPIATVVFVGVLISTALAYVHTRSTVQELALERIERNLKFLDTTITTHISDLSFDLELWSREDVFRLALQQSYLGRSARDAAAKRLRTRIGAASFSRIRILDHQGGTIADTSVPPRDASDMAENPAVATALGGGFGMATHTEVPDAGPILIMATPIRDHESTVRGAMVAELAMHTLSKQLLGNFAIGEQGRAAIVRDDGEFLAQADKKGPIPWKRPLDPRFLEMDTRGKTVIKARRAEFKDLSGRVLRNETTGWYLIVAANRDEILRPARRMATLSGIISLCTIALVALSLGALRRAMRTLRESEKQMALFFDLAPAAIVVSRRTDEIIIKLNQFCETLTGYSVADLLGSRSMDLGLWEDRAQKDAFFRKLDAENEVHDFPFRLRTKDGSIKHCLVSSSRLTLDGVPCSLSILRDETEHRKMNEIMVQTEKMLSVGGLAAGMAHEINNPLGAILQSTQNLARRLSPDVEANERVAEELELDLRRVERYMEKRGIHTYIQGIRDSGNRAATIVRNMLDFSRKSQSQIAPCDMNVLLDNAVDLAANDYDLKKKYDFKRIRIERRFAPSLPKVQATQTDIEQVFLNLLKNAAQAMGSMPEDAPHPTIALRTSFEDGMVHIEVEDNGPGMDEETRKRIFEPFFTTKVKGEGTGLGLSVSYFIITQSHGGTFLVDSAPGRGTVFSISLPLDPQVGPSLLPAETMTEEDTAAS